MEKSELNGEKFARRLRRPRHIGSSCDVLNLLALHHARLLSHSGAAAFGRGTADDAASGRAGASGATLRVLRTHCNEEKFVRRATRAWRLRRQRHIGSSCDALNLLALHHARLLSRSGAAAEGYGRAGASGAAATFLNASLSPFCSKPCASARSQRCCGLRPQHLWRRGLRPHRRLRRRSARPSDALRCC